MNLADAVEWVQDLVDLAEPPAIGVELVDRWVRQEAATTDADGLAPGDEDWTPTFNAHRLHAVVARCFEWKAARCASRFTFSTDGQRFEVGNLHTQYLTMARLHRSRLSASQTTR